MRVFGYPAYGDLNGDGFDYAALFLQYDPGGSGTFYYVAAAIFTGDGWLGTRAVLLGDRIAPLSLKIRNGLIIASYLGRRPEKPLSAPPTVDMNMILTVDNDWIKTLSNEKKGTN